jgi:hypothetical protein
MQEGQGQCGQPDLLTVSLGAEKSAAAGTNCLLLPAPRNTSARILLSFCHGTALADELA